MPQSQQGRIVYGIVSGPNFREPVPAMVRTMANGSRVWKSVGAKRWQALTPVAVFIPDAKQPQDAESMGRA
jgi:hypothetical protein